MRSLFHRRRWSMALLCALVWLLAGCSSAVTVEWRTETEMNTAGFNLYRGVSPDGPFDTRVNAQLIPPSADPLTGKAYSYVDRGARPGTTYYYELQEVEQDGTVNRYGPIRVTASSFNWIHGLVLGALGAGVLALWIWGGRRRAAGQTGTRPPDSDSKPG